MDDFQNDIDCLRNDILDATNNPSQSHTPRRHKCKEKRSNVRDAVETDGARPGYSASKQILLSNPTNDASIFIYSPLAGCYHCCHRRWSAAHGWMTCQPLEPDIETSWMMRWATHKLWGQLVDNFQNGIGCLNDDSDILDAGKNPSQPHTHFADVSTLSRPLKARPSVVAYSPGRSPSPPDPSPRKRTIPNEAQLFHSELESAWQITALGEAKLVVGIALERDRVARTILLSQMALVDKIISKYHQTDA
ncbi:hypothetical protein EDB85DRAFT_2145122 [Lactarius pseudohatsudake]|nr:hypothetical protein EDB85DRAFT_2145122 [Lactarius pseudohatsudake]